MPVDKSQTHRTEGEPRRKRSALPEEALWSNLRSVYLGTDKDSEFSPMTAGRIHQRMIVLKAQHSQKSRFSWNLAFSLAAAFLLLLLVVPMFPPLPGTGESQRNEMRQFVSSFDATSAGSPLPLEAPLAPKASPIPEPTAEGFTSPAGMGSGGVQYNSVTLVFAAPEQIAVLTPRFPDAQQYADGIFLQTQGDQETKIILPAVERVVIFQEAVQGPDVMPIGSDLLIIAPSSPSILEEASWPVLAWRAFLASMWPWGLILVLTALGFLYFYYRQARPLWAGIFLALILLSLIWPLFYPVGEDNRLLLESSGTLSEFRRSTFLATAEDAPLTIFSNSESLPSDSPFSLPLGSPRENLPLLLESYGLEVMDSGTAVDIVESISLPTRQLFPLQLTFLGLRALLLLVPLFLYAWLTFSRRLQVLTLKGEDRLPKLL
ncbi:MAG: hypothetical protein WCO14_00885 [bacterium]